MVEFWFLWNFSIYDYDESDVHECIYENNVCECDCLFI